MNQMRCDSCGAKLKVDTEKKIAYCEYCGSKVYLNNEKLELIKNQQKIFKCVFIFIICISIFILITIFSHIIFAGKIFDKAFENNEIVDHKEEFSEFDKIKFNGQFEMLSGTMNAMFTKDLLQLVVNSNKKDKQHSITVVYNDITTDDPNEIIDIKNSLKDITYEIILDYDDNGFINKITLSV